MRIALILEHVDPRRGGRETSTAQIAAQLAHRGQDVTVLCQTAGAPLPGVTVRSLGRPGRSRTDRLRRFVRNVQRVLRDEVFDVSHAMLPIPGATIYQPRGGTPAGNRAAKRRMAGRWGALTTMLSYSFNPHRRLLGRLERDTAAATLLLPNSDMVAREITQYLGPHVRQKVVWNGVDVPDVSDEQKRRQRRQRRAALGLGEDETVFLTVARHWRLKGVDCAIRALARCVASDHLLILGRSKPGRYAHLARRLGVGRRVHFLAPTDDVFAWYSAADACLLLSWYDACSRVVLEALRWGLPAITTRSNGAADLLTSGAGVVVPRPDNLDAVVHAMRRLADADQRRRCRTECETLADFLSLRRHVDELLAVYAEGIAGG